MSPVAEKVRGRQQRLQRRWAGKRKRPSRAATQLHSHRHIAHSDVSSYLGLIRVIMSPALIYVVIPSPQSCIDRS